MFTLTPKQFFAYCERNGIHSIAIEQSFDNFGDNLITDYPKLSNEYAPIGCQTPIFTESPNGLYYSVTQVYDIRQAYKVCESDMLNISITYLLT